MIRSGWILPDLYEIKCSSCSTLNGHIEVVKRYLNALKERDIKTYNEITSQFYNDSSSFSALGLDDFAVMRLGWIKINNDPVNIIFYTDNTELSFFVKRYVNIGYTSVILTGNKPIITVDIPSKELI